MGNKIPQISSLDLSNNNTKLFRDIPFSSDIRTRLLHLDEIETCRLFNDIEW